MKRAAFTLIELILVMTLVGIFVSVIALDFGSARRRQELNLTTEEMLALLQQQAARVRAGHTENGELLCEGVHVDTGFLLQVAKAPFLVEENRCGEPKLEPYGKQGSPILLWEAWVGDVPMDSFWIFFVPPKGEFQVYNETQDALLTGAVILEFTHDREEGLGHSIQLDPLSQTIHFYEPTL